MLVNEPRGEVAVLLNRGNGVFAEPTLEVLGGFSSSFAMADLDADGNLDVAIPRFLDKENADLAILLGRGDGSFQGGFRIPLASVPPSIAVADFEGDGKTDLVVTLRSAILIYERSGSRWSETTTRAFAESTYSADPGELSGDKRPDLIVATESGLWLLVNLGDGSFSEPVHIGEVDYFLGVDDLNGDTVPDVLGAQQMRSSFSVFLGRRDGSFDPPVSYFAGPGVSSATVEDFDGDGDLDVAITQGAADRVSIHFNRTLP